MEIVRSDARASLEKCSQTWTAKEVIFNIDSLYNLFFFFENIKIS